MIHSATPKPPARAQRWAGDKKSEDAVPQAAKQTNTEIAERAGREGEQSPRYQQGRGGEEEER
jgi:hypothetical protein